MIIEGEPVMDNFEAFVKDMGEAERIDFEKSFSNLKLNRDACGEYAYRYVQHAWEGWLYCAYHKATGMH
jgi:hypothetical protein